MKLAIPTNAPGGMGAQRSGHFGHCDVFTIVDIAETGETVDTQTIANQEHEAGGCLAPVSLLRDAGVEAIVVAGLGKRPMQGFSEAGIVVYYADIETVPNVESVMESMAKNKLVVMRPDQSCQGSGNCHH